MARVLVIDDSPIMREFIEATLLDLGHDVVAVSTGEDGIAYLRDESFDLCICDMHLPRMSGYDVLTAMSPEDTLDKWLFTDSMPDHNAEKIRSQGNYAYLRKPFELEQLRSELHRLLIPTTSDIK